MLLGIAAGTLVGGIWGYDTLTTGVAGALAAEVFRLRESVQRGRPFGGESWTSETASKLGLEASLRPRGRPRKPPDSEGTLFS